MEDPEKISAQFICSSKHQEDDELGNETLMLCTSSRQETHITHTNSIFWGVCSKDDLQLSLQYASN